MGAGDVDHLGRMYRGGPSSVPRIGTQGTLAPRQEIVLKRDGEAQAE